MNSRSIAVVGAGAWGMNLIRNFHTLGALRVVCDSALKRLELVRERYPDVECETEFANILKRDDITAVVIATPAPTHATLALQALQADKDVFVEKPMALNFRDGERMVEEADKRGRILMVGHVLEYHPAIVRLRQLIDAGELGKLQYIYSNRLNLGRFRTEENALWSFAPHDIALMLRLLREMPKVITCTGGSYLNANVADVTVSTFEFASGVRGHIFVSWLHPFKEQKLIVVGDRKMACFDDTEPMDKLVLYEHHVEWVERVPVARGAEAQVVDIERVEPLRRECEHFMKCITERKQPLTDGKSGLRVLKVLEACQRSLERDGAPVTLEETPVEGIAIQKFFAHPTATIDPGCEIGDGTKIWHYTHVMSGARIGRNCILGQNVFVARNVTIGDNVKIQNNVSVYEGVTLEDGVFCGPSMVFTNVLNPRSEIERKHEFRPTLVKRGATLGANCTIICGRTIGRYAFVGAGAVVTKDVPDYALVIGVPARIAGWVCRCGTRLEFEKDETKSGERATCHACGARYRKENEVVMEE